MTTSRKVPYRYKCLPVFEGRQGKDAEQPMIVDLKNRLTSLSFHSSLVHGHTQV